ncbi:olfactory receptor 52R1-like [Microtus ochrogaster]|uniref:Olfactory receptor 52R1-like n=1 Tax=Microtus ochrogaster TaxID=79684 RepID=A0ABM0LM64_MICOH|nr:olfactory receptor 52R1-like [Microtus ochrogaster]
MAHIVTKKYVDAPFWAATCSHVSVQGPCFCWGHASLGDLHWHPGAMMTSESEVVPKAMSVSVALQQLGAYLCSPAPGDDNEDDLSMLAQITLNPDDRSHQMRVTYCGQGQSYCEHMAVLKLVCADTKINRGYGLFVAFSVASFDLIVISASYVMILRAVLRLPSSEARLKAFGTCASHIGVSLTLYIPALFTFLTHRFGHHVPRVVHIMFANVYLLVPPMLNPIIYGVRTKQIRDRVIQGCCRKGP